MRNGHCSATQEIDYQDEAFVSCGVNKHSASPFNSSSSSSSSSTHRRKYEVFLSFRGETRYEFTDTLFEKLKSMGIIVFRDKESLLGGEEINPALKAAIEESHNAAVIISPGFTQSKACLFELTVIMECWRMGRLAVFPIFYHINPSKVGKLMTDFKNHFHKLKDDPKDAKERKWEYWKSLLEKIANWPVDPMLDKDPAESSGRALKKLSDISAWVVPQNSYINPIIDEICRMIWERTISDLPYISNSLVGIESAISNIMQLLDLEKEKEVRVIGICGMGGIGKSILAEVIYEKVFPQFDARYFSKPIGKEENKDYLVSIQENLISNIFPGAAHLLNNAYKVKHALRTKLHERKVFIVLDDLWYNTQVKELVEDLKWFGPGSRIIFTSRNHDLLHLHEDNIYEVEKLNKDDALKLFCLKAFKQPQPKEGFSKLSEHIVRYAEGLPLALDTCGSSLSNKKDKKQWDGYLKELQDVPNMDILSILQKSVEELDGKTIYPGQVFPLKELFLDIACFFNGCLKDHVLRILKGVEGFGNNLEHYLSVLKEKSLLRISNDGKLWMHDLLVDLGQRMAKKSRLLQMEDIARELKTETPQENPNVKGIVLQLPLPKEERFSLEDLSAMVNLRVLQISWEYDRDHKNGLNLKWLGDLFKLSEELRIMEWVRYPLKSLPADSNFGIKLVELKLHFSEIEQLWAGKKSFPELKHLQLFCLEKLIEIPDLSGIPNLEILDVFGCENLSTLHPSFGNLKLLKELSIEDSKNLQELPNEIISKSLEVLSLHGCVCVEQCPNVPHSLQCLRSLCIGWTSIKELPFSSKRLPFLEEFFAYPSGLEELPSFILSSEKLRKLCVGGLESFPSFRLPTSFLAFNSLELLGLSGPNMTDEARPLNLSGLSSLQCLNLSYSNFTKIPDIVSQVPNLDTLHLSGCEVKKLSEPQFSNFSNLRFLQVLSLCYCNLKAIPESIGLCSSLSELDLGSNSFTELPNSIRELSKLEELHLQNCTSLESLPKLPLSLEFLRLENCPKLQGYERQMPTQIAREMLLENNHSFTVAYVGLDGKSYKVLYLNLESPLYKSKKDYLIQPIVAYGPTLEPRILDWFVHRSIGSRIEVQIPMDWSSDDGMYEPWACALLIVYEVYGHDKRKSRKRKWNELMNSIMGASEGSKGIFPEFVCQIQLNEAGPKHRFVICVPEVAHVGSHGLWVCIHIPNSSQKPRSLERWSCHVSITAGNKNVVLKEGGARLLNRDAHLELAKAISGMDSQSLTLALNRHLTVVGPIKKEKKEKKKKKMMMMKKKKKKKKMMMMIPFKNKVRF